MNPEFDLRGAVVAAIDDANLSHGDWDSLDVLLLLTLVEERTGLMLPDGSFAPTQLANADDIVEMLIDCGVASGRRARLRVSWDGTLDPTARRSIEYQASLAWPAARIAVRQTDQVELVALAPSAELLPLASELRAVLAGAPHRVVDVTQVARVAATAPVTGGRHDSRKRVMSLVATVQEWVLDRGGEVWPPPASLVEISLLARLGYLKTLSDQLLRTDDSHALVPAVCFPLYDALAERFAGEGMLVTTLGQAFRNEPVQLDPLGRLTAFHVQELVWMGDRTWCDEIAHEVEELGTRVTGMLGFSVAWRPASDPFFLRSFSSWHATKREAVATVQHRALAVGSVNDHGRFFTSAVNCQLPEYVVSGCAGFGIERCLLASEDT